MAGTVYTTDNTFNGFITSNLSGGIKAKREPTIWAKTGTDALEKDWPILPTIIMNQKFSRFLPPIPQQTPNTKRSPAEELVTPMTMLVRVIVADAPLTLSKGHASVYVDGVLDGTTKFYFPGKKTITGLSIGRGFGNNHGPNTTIDEATFAKVGRSSQWISASYQNQKPNSNYLNFGNLVGPISLNVILRALKSTERRIYWSIPYRQLFRNWILSATGLPPGLTINATTGEISGSTSVVGSQNFTVTATGTTAGGASVTVSKQYKIVISDPSSFPFSVNLTIPASQVNSTLTDFPLLVSLSSSISGFSYNAFLDTDGDGIRRVATFASLPQTVRNCLTNLPTGTPQVCLGYGESSHNFK